MVLFIFLRFYFCKVIIEVGGSSNMITTLKTPISYFLWCIHFSFIVCVYLILKLFLCALYRKTLWGIYIIYIMWWLTKLNEIIFVNHVMHVTFFFGLKWDKFYKSCFYCWIVFKLDRVLISLRKYDFISCYFIVKLYIFGSCHVTPKHDLSPLCI